MSVELLKRSVLFREFSPVGLEILAKQFRPRIVLSGKPLFVEGTKSEALYLVLEGSLKVFLKMPDGKEAPLASLGAGEHLGELSLLVEQPVQHACSAVAESDTKVLELTKADFKETMGKKPQACIKLLLAIAQEFGAKAAACREPLKMALSRAAR